MKNAYEEVSDKVQTIVSILWNKGLIKRNNLGHHHSHLQIELDSNKINNEPEIRELIIDWLIIICGLNSIDFDFILGRHKWLIDFSLRINKPIINPSYIETINLFQGKTILIIEDKFYIPQITHELDRVKSLGGKVTDVISIFFNKDEPCHSILTSLEKSFKIHPFLTKEDIEKGEKEFLAYRKIKEVTQQFSINEIDKVEKN